MRALQGLGYTVGLTTLLMGLPAATFVALSAPAVPKGWVRIKTESDNKTWYVDNGTISGKGRYRYFWSYITGGSPYADPEAGERLVHSTAFYLSVDCQRKQYRLRYARLFDENRQLIKELDYGNKRELGDATPGTGEEASLVYVCSRRR